MMVWNKTTGQALKSRSDVLKTSEHLSMGPAAQPNLGAGSGPQAPTGSAEHELASAAAIAPSAGVPVISCGDGSPEGIAYKLFLHIITMERISLAPGYGQWQHDRRWVLATYVQCLQAVKNGIVD